MEALTFRRPLPAPMPRSVLLLALLASVAATAQPSEADRLRGYAEADGVTFVFDAARYGLDPALVTVTGPFRGWTTDMEDPAWALTEADGVWTLAVDPDAVGLGPATPFKFRADGRWLDPAPGAENVAGGNLIYRFGEVPVRVVAEFRSDDAVWVRVDGAERPLTLDAYALERWDGRDIPLSGVVPNEAATATLRPAWQLDTQQVHTVTVQVDGQPVRARVRFDGLWRDLMPIWPADKPAMGPVVEFHPGTAEGSAAAPRPDSWSTTLRLFAPRADSVVVHLYDTATGPETARHALRGGPDGWWLTLREDLRGVWYDYSVYGPDGPGSAFTNQTGETVSDPYALVSDDSWGRARIWQDDFDPAAPVAGGRPSMEEVVAYEVHLQDFTDALPLADGVGPLEGFIARGLTNERGEAIGFDHLVGLGVNTVHLMPVQEFLHYPDAEWQAAFADDPLMQEQGIAEENYQWGYRTTHAFAIESRFRSEGDEPGRERERLRDLVDAFHREGIAVVVDVVFNHTGENMEGDERLFTFNGIDKWYYYRLDDDGNHVGAFGNEVKSENRPYTQRWLLDQLRHLVDTFGIDGFRIDLAGQTDEQTLRWLQAELGEDVLIYGEPWIASNDPDYEANPSWDWYKADSPITFFQDDARNAFKGTPLDDPTPAPASRGFSGGDPAMRDAALQGIANAYAEEATPNGGINYLDIHDNWALADRFAACQTGECRWDGRQGVRDAEMRIAATLLLTSLGPVVLHGGTEFAKSKGLAPLAEEWGGELRLDAMPLAPIYLKGRGDTYNLRAANAYDWSQIGADAPVDRAAMLDWWRGLLALRASEHGDVFRVGTEVPEGWVQPFYGEDDRVLAYLVGGRVLVGINGSDQRVELPVDLPNGTWRYVALSDEMYGVIAPDSEIADVDLLARPGPVLVIEPKGVSIQVRD